MSLNNSQLLNILHGHLGSMREKDVTYTFIESFSLLTDHTKEWFIRNGKCLICGTCFSENGDLCQCAPAIIVTKNIVKDEHSSIIKKERRIQYDRKSSRIRHQREEEAEGYFKQSDINEIFKIQKGKCYFCRTSIDNKFEVEHLNPLSKGGSNWPSNIVLSCKKCNQRKYNKTAHKFWSILKKEVGYELIKSIIRENRKNYYLKVKLSKSNKNNPISKRNK